MAVTALRHPCLLSIETLHRRFARVDPAGYSVVLTINAGYE